jgi:hypothetical protein
LYFLQGTEEKEEEEQQEEAEEQEDAEEAEEQEEDEQEEAEKVEEREDNESSIFCCLFMCVLCVFVCKGRERTKHRQKRETERERERERDRDPLLSPSLPVLKGNKLKTKRISKNTFQFFSPLSLFTTDQTMNPHFFFTTGLEFPLPPDQTMKPPLPPPFFCSVYLLCVCVWGEVRENDSSRRSLMWMLFGLRFL